MPTFNLLGPKARALYRNLISDPDLVALWPLNEASGTIYDRCTKNILNGTVAGNPVYATSLGKGFYGLNFDGTGDLVSFGNVSALAFNYNTPLTFLLVTVPNVGGSNEMLFSKFGGGIGWRWFLTSGRLPIIQLINTGTTNELQVRADTALTNGTLVMIAVTLDGTGAAAGTVHYQNGVAVADTDVTNTLSATIANAIAAQIGANNGAEIYNGDIGLVAVFSAAKPANDMRRWAWLGGLL